MIETMLPELVKESSPLPVWLENASKDDPLPLADLLTQSLYYPACGFDGRPIQYFGGAVYSFVYVDAHQSYENLLEQLNSFKGYRLKFSRTVDAKELNIVSIGQYLIDKKARRDWKRSAIEVFRYAVWVIYERLPEFDDDFGPKLFSLLYIGGEGVSAYYSLYKRSCCSPVAVALIKCDGFTSNWTRFYDAFEIFALIVIKGKLCPKYLLTDANTNGSQSWFWYPIKLCDIKSRSHSVKINQNS